MSLKPRAGSDSSGRLSEGDNMQICSPRLTPSPRRSNPQTLTLRKKIMNKVNNSDNHKRELFVHLFIDLFICLLE